MRRFPKTIGIFNEYLQNADDAGATAVEFILDQRTYPSANLPAPQMAALMGPALLSTTTRVFDEDDFTKIQEIGDSGKTMELAKAGRFDFGINSSYNITDFPCFLTGEWLYFFDPHQGSHAGR